MSIESIKALLDAATEELDTGVLETLASLCPDVDAAMAVVTLHKHAPTDLRALLKVAEAAKALALAEADAPTAPFRELPDTHPGWLWLIRTSHLSQQLAIALEEVEGTK